MDREEVIRNLRACLLSIKGGLKLESLSQDYKTLVGENIPFKKLGYPSLVAFLKTVPGIRATDKGGQCFIEALPTQESAHLTKLIAQQKQSSKKGHKKVHVQFAPRVKPRKPVTVYSPKPKQQTVYPPRVGNAPPYQQQRQQISQQPLPHYQQHHHTVHSVQNTMKENKDPKNGLNVMPSGLDFQVLSPLSPARLLSGNLPPRQSKAPISPPTTNVNVSTKLPKAPTGPDPRLELLARANAFNLPDPVYKILPTKIKNTKEPSVFAQVKIGPHGYGSYPKEARNEDEAQKIAAIVALNDLTEKYGLPSNVIETTDKLLIRDRILAIADNHPNGVFMHQIPILYKQEYTEVLPSDWQMVIKGCPSIILENGVDNSIILRRFTLPTTPAREFISPKKEKVLLNPIGPPIPGQLQLPEDECWIVSVTNVVSTTEIWARLIGDMYNEKFEALTTDMMLHYTKVKIPVKVPAIEIGNYYAIFVDDSWHRVRCIEHNTETGIVKVSFIDLGDEDTFPHTKLQALEKQFCLLPAQAFRLTLSGLEDFNDCDCIITEIEKRLLDHAFYVEVIRCGEDEYGPHATVIFYDTNGPDDINLNELFADQILENVITVPKLDEDRQVSEVFVSHVNKNGDIYVQVQSECMKHLVKLLNRLNNSLNPETLKENTVIQIDVQKIYFACVDGNWYRAKVLERGLNQCKIFLIDFGKTATVASRKMLPLDKLSDALCRYPPQALKVHLHNIGQSMFNEKMAARLSELAPEGEPLLAKVVKSSTTDVPVVELLKRIQPSNMLVSINNTLVYEEELNAKTQGDGNNNIKPRKRIERMNSKAAVNEGDDFVKTLKPPKISGIGQYFDVRVSMAAHPGNFIVQPYSDHRSLEAMMIQLQEVCLAYKGPTPSVTSIQEGKIFAAEHLDGHWYRVCISSIIRESMVSVYFCDFGDISMLPLTKLQPLKSQFFELPYQAIKAKLVGIRPVNGDWSVEDSLRFQELVVEKNFVSMVMESAPDGVSPADTVLGLKLINVDTNEDIHIDQLLVREGRAVFTEA